MNRSEFCNIMLELRKSSNVKMADICANMGVLPTAVYRIERGSGNFEISKALLYLASINYSLTMTNGDKCVEITNIESIATWLKAARNGIYTQRSLAEAVGCTYPTIANIERGSNKVTVDNFLKLADTLGYTIKIEPK